ncbi:hypothetical protein [Beijerinckia indica]|uniref:Uncharacterized protein n=1 Tax=Beijerinckia indica subsp. indica (strain ATCC 9039 / DSM 1715 / NCIMB 8712) TaxID=395963 RepID=B2ICE9_BEII9|nr:hypothetical protein [Beijerinckia indica]ACB96745.1 hypothetical protein Bind_3185 [Beijerinckia indica subsp. indica ATCC 9039]
MPTSLPPRVEPRPDEDSECLEAIGLTLFYLGGCVFYACLIVGWSVKKLVTDRELPGLLVSLCRSWLACCCFWLARKLLKFGVFLAPYVEGKNNV